jgi:hypothetical protein
LSWEPHAGSQVDTLETRLWLRELFLGGSRGGGKTDVLLADYASDVKEFGSAWKGIMFRKTFSQFEEIVDRSKEMFADLLGADPSRCYNSSKMLWRFPNGAKLQFFHMKDDSDADKHLGLQYTWIGWDELPHWESDKPYKKLMACLRSSRKGMPLRVRATGNPGGPGLGWLKKRFQIPNDVRERIGPLVEDPSAIRATTMGRMFIRSTTSENTTLINAQPDYYDTLRTATEGNEQLAKAWIDGDFNVFFGKFFTTFREDIHRVSAEDVLPGGKVPHNWRLYGCLDYGDVNPTCFLLFAVDPERNCYVIDEFYQGGLYPDAYAGKILDLVKTNEYTEGRKPDRIIADTSIFSTRATATYGARDKFVSDILRVNTGMRFVKANKDRLSGWRLMKNMLAWEHKIDDLGRSTGQILKAPRLMYFPECGNLEYEMENAVHAGSEDNPKEDLNTKGDDHALDALRYGLMAVFAGRQPEALPEDSYATMETYKKQRNRPDGWRNESFVIDPASNYRNVISFQEILERAT